MAQYLKHFKRTHILGGYSYKQFALICMPDEEGDACITLLRCKFDKVRKDVLRFGSFNEKDLKAIENIKRGEQIFIDKNSLIIRLS